MPVRAPRPTPTACSLLLYTAFLALLAMFRELAVFWEAAAGHHVYARARAAQVPVHHRSDAVVSRSGSTPRVCVCACMRVCVGLRGCRFGGTPPAVDGVVRLPMRLAGAGVPGAGCTDNATTSLACEMAVTERQASYSPSLIVCTLPAGVGGGFLVWQCVHGASEWLCCSANVQRFFVHTERTEGTPHAVVETRTIHQTCSSYTPPCPTVATSRACTGVLKKALCDLRDS